jgi:putative membrane protein
MEQKKLYKNLIIFASVFIPLAVALLFQIRIEGYDLSFLPLIYSFINGLTAVLLVIAVIQIKNGNRKAHENLMKTNMVLSAIFLVMYILYHITSDPTEYGGTGWIRYVYYFILISHIVLSVTVTPLVLFTFWRGWTGDFERHRKIAKITFPVWLYIAVTGVIVYWMISPYYQ